MVDNQISDETQTRCATRLSDFGSGFRYRVAVVGTHPRATCPAPPARTAGPCAPRTW